MHTAIVRILSSRVAETAAGRRAGRGLLRPALALPAAVILAAILVQMSVQAQTALQFDRSAVTGGQWWRVVTCHLSHWGWPHLAADLGAFAALWWLGRDRGFLKSAVVLAAFPAVGLAVHAGAGDVAVYRGLSAIDYALLAFVLVSPLPASDRSVTAVRLGLLAAVAAKVACDAVAVGTVPGIGLPVGVVTVGVAHAAGLAVGTAGGLWAWLLERRSAGAVRTAALGGFGAEGSWHPVRG